MGTPTDTAARLPGRRRTAMSSTALAAAPRQDWFREKILLGMDLRTYLRSLATPLNALATLLIGLGVTVLVYRFAAGLGASTNLSQAQPWGLWIGFDMMSGIVLAAGGFTIGSAVHLFGMHEYHPIARPAILTAFLGYVLAVVGLMADLGKPWNFYNMMVTPGSAS